MMRRHRKRGGLARAGLTVLGLLAGGTAHAGHWWCIDNCADIPPGAMPAPPGYFVRSWEHAQAAKAAEDDFVIYKHEWYMGGTAPGPYGMYHLNEIAKRLPQVPFHVVLQPELRADVNEARRLVVIQQLLQCGITDAAERVIIAFPQAEGLYGEEAVRIFARQISGRGAGGGIGTTGGSFSGIGVGGAGFSSGFGGSLGVSSRGGGY